MSETVTIKLIQGEDGWYRGYVGADPLCPICKGKGFVSTDEATTPCECKTNNPHVSS